LPRPESGSSSPCEAASADVVDEDCSFLGRPQATGELGTLGPFRILELLGAGATGIVFRAEDSQLRRQVALKVLRPTIAASSHSRRRFLREARAAASFEHDNIVTIYQVGEDGGIPWLAMKLLRGQSLKDRLNGPTLCLPTDHVLRLGAEVADALSVAHKGGLVHRDIKPSNILLEDGTDRAKLIDFGLVLVDDEEGQLTRTGCVVGTPSYMAPEQADGAAVDARSDLYGLGCVLYRSTTGRVPFEGQTYLQVFFAQRTREPVHPQKIDPSLPSGLSDLVMQLLAKNPSDRPPTAGAVRDALRALRTDHSDPWPRELPPAQQAAPATAAGASASEPPTLTHRVTDSTVHEPGHSPPKAPAGPGVTPLWSTDFSVDEAGRREPPARVRELEPTAVVPAVAAANAATPETAAKVATPETAPKAATPEAAPKAATPEAAPKAATPAAVPKAAAKTAAEASAVSKKNRAPTNPWADVLSEVYESPAARLAAEARDPAAKLRRQKQLRRLVWIAVASVALLILSIILASRF
jgi:serine/threonine protein kinase